MEEFDVVIVGAGMAGASLAWALAPKRRVLLLEQESQPGYHSTGRSAATLHSSYGNATVRALTAASAPFYRDPPPGFAETALARPLGVLMVAREDQLDLLERGGRARAALSCPASSAGTRQRCLARVPALRREQIAAALSIPTMLDLDVAAILAGFLRGARAAGAASAHRCGPGRRGCRRRRLAAAAARRRDRLRGAGQRRRCLGRRGGRPRRPRPARHRAQAAHRDHRPAAGGQRRRVLADDRRCRRGPGTSSRTPAGCCARPPTRRRASPATRSPTSSTSPSAPSGSRPRSTFPIRRIESRWAGLRCFAADKTPVAGFDPRASGFFWLAGQGGYGIQTAPGAGHAGGGADLRRACPGAAAGRQPRPATRAGFSPAA